MSTAWTPASDTFWACHRLAVAYLPAARLRALLGFAGSPEAALHVGTPDLRGPRIGLTEKQAARLAEAAGQPIPAAARKAAETLDVSVIGPDDPAYPANLTGLDDAPPLLFVRGRLHPDDRFSIAIVGSRRATHYGRMQAERFARAFAERGLAVLSGGAAGIDTAAHRGALAAGGRTIAILGCGVDVVYPAENRTLFADIVRQNGALVSEFPLQTTPEAWRFPTRNRIIAGMARGTVLVETPRESGALITARDAAGYGRDVWVVPGPVDTGRSRGGHQLIQDGAALADAPEDVLSALGVSTLDVPAVAAREEAAPPASPPEPADLSAEERRLLAQFDLSPRHLDEAATGAGLSAPQATVALTLLEMKGLVRRQPGNLCVRAL